ncbi:DUF4283 domain protein [Senna tora]|uniref:DUF4283 domain protein n=1 Tax=Senna tora TaxID=362788 RepID=A0A834SEN3_9FABA|nr:DUF4283 domain protein [Senna tora]
MRFVAALNTRWALNELRRPPCTRDVVPRSLFGYCKRLNQYSESGRDDEVLVVYGEDEVLNATNTRVEEMDRNTFLFHFVKEKDMERALDNGPWIFSNKWLTLTRWKRGVEGLDDALSTVNIWMQVWGVPLHCRTEKVATKLCYLMGNVKEGANLGNKNDGVFGWILGMRKYHVAATTAAVNGDRRIAWPGGGKTMGEKEHESKERKVGWLENGHEQLVQKIGSNVG